MARSPAGWPRPRNTDGWPIPWLSVPDRLGEALKRRARDTRAARACQVCGLPFDPAGRAYALAEVVTDADVPDPPPGERLPDGYGIQAMDGGLLHWRCLRLALAWCPKLHEVLAAGELRVAEVPPRGIVASGADVLIVDVGTVFAGGPRDDDPVERPHHTP